MSATVKKIHRINCQCYTCKGSGQITCHDCAGYGRLFQSVSEVSFTDEHPKYDELAMLRDDARRVEVQFDELCTAKPERIESYTRQRDAVLTDIARNMMDLLKQS